MRVLITGASGVLGRALLPLLDTAGHDVCAPGRSQARSLRRQKRRASALGVDAVYHLVTRIPPRERRGEPEAWRENDRLRADAARILVDAALAARTEVYVQPSVTFFYPDHGDVDEDTPVRDVPAHLASSLAAERAAARFAQAGRRGVVLRLGRLDGPGTEYDVPEPGASPDGRRAGYRIAAREWVREWRQLIDEMRRDVVADEAAIAEWTKSMMTLGLGLAAKNKKKNDPTASPYLPFLLPSARIWARGLVLMKQKTRLSGAFSCGAYRDRTGDLRLQTRPGASPGVASSRKRWQFRALGISLMAADRRESLLLVSTIVPSSWAVNRTRI